MKTKETRVDLSEFAGSYTTEEATEMLKKMNEKIADAIKKNRMNNEVVVWLFKKKVSDTKFIGIVPARTWFKEWFAKKQKQMPYFIRRDDFVVCSWMDFHDGEYSHIEAKQTIAICRTEEDAQAIYKKHKK